jgi:hypothetical protein
MRTSRVTFLFLAAVVALAAHGGAPAARAGVEYRAYLPIVRKASASAGVCPTSSGNSYQAGPAIQWDTDNPVRLASQHADKNINLRGYTSTSGNTGFVNYGSDDPTQPPQLATLFNPNRVPASSLYRINNWNWAPSPSAGTPGGPVTIPPVTVIGMQTTTGEALRAPTSGYDIGGGMEVIVIYADADTIALQYGRTDSAASGYTVHVDNICTDPNLLNLYNSLDGGARYVYKGTPDTTPDYNLPNLPAGQVFGTARGTQVRVAIVDSGAYMDPRSCNEWWQIRPNHPGC